MLDIPTTIAVLQDALLRRFGDEVDLIFQYGSHLHGATHRFSDVDLSWVPVHDDTWGSITVMVDETLFDLYAMHWSHLERMADFRDVSSSVLLHNRILYQRNDTAAERFSALADRLRAWQEPAARRDMVRRALEIFQSSGYDYYLLCEQAAAGHTTGTLKSAQAILRTVLHCLAVVNQACIDTRKLEQVLALPRLPDGFAATVARVTQAMAPHEVAAATEALLQSTRALLLDEQRDCLTEPASYPAAFHAAYPELKRDLQAVMLGCERAEMMAVKGAVLSLLHELSRMVAQAESGFVAESFNPLADYAQDLTALGFPDLVGPMLAGDFGMLHDRCLAFDRRLRTFLAEHDVALNDFAALDELQRFLAVRR